LPLPEIRGFLWKSWNKYQLSIGLNGKALKNKKQVLICANEKKKVAFLKIHSMLGCFNFQGWKTQLNILGKCEWF